MRPGTQAILSQQRAIYTQPPLSEPENPAPELKREPPTSYRKNPVPQALLGAIRATQ
jgi:hypothetical protein